MLFVGVFVIEVVEIGRDSDRDVYRYAKVVLLFNDGSTLF